MGNLNGEANDVTMKFSVKSTVAKLLPKIKPVSKILYGQLVLT